MAYAPRYRYVGCCVALDGEDINAMVEQAREVCLSSFTRLVDHQDWLHIKRTLGYSKLFRIETDWHVTFATSEYKGKRCAYLVHSAIEYVFTEGK